MAKKATKTIDGDVLKIVFEGGEEISVNLGSIPPEIQTRLAMHGLSQKIGDSYAGVEATEAFAKASAVAEDLLAGNWSTRVAASGPRATQLAEALAAATGKTMEEASAVLEGMDEDAKKDLRKHPQIKVQLATIKAAAAQKAAAKAAEEAEGADALTL
jgi:hypothetical protein